MSFGFWSPLKWYRSIANQVFLNSGSTSPATQPVQTFTYQYDQLNRLKSGVSTGAVSPVLNMSETAISYDKMGNIKNLTRDGTAYTYDYSYSTPDGNQLKMITGMMAGSY
ncbi:hypothetical protein ACFQZI_19860, partial [Mucilaginibacter lutimaris]